MMTIICPWCGPRDENEFVCGGDAHIARPGPPHEVDEAEWAEYLFARANTKGEIAERWVHNYGCGQWFNMLRDTVSHRIIAIYPMGTTRPESLAR